VLEFKSLEPQMGMIFGERARGQLKIICSSLRQSDDVASGSALACLERSETKIIKPTVGRQGTLSKAHKDSLRESIIDRLSVAS
jgi:hypothetical protein